MRNKNALWIPSGIGWKAAQFNLFRSRYEDFKGRIAGWDSPDVNTKNAGVYIPEVLTFFPKEAMMEKVPCTDHPFMETNTYYPRKGACFR